MKTYWYGPGMRRVHDGSLLWLTHTIRVALVGPSYAPNTSTHAFFSSVQSHEVSSLNYVAGGQSLTGKLVESSSTGLQVFTHFRADDIAWLEVSLTARWGVIYRDTGTASTSPLLGLIDFEAEVTANEGDFSFFWSGDGVLYARGERP